MRWFQLELDLERIRQEMSRQDATNYTLDDVRAWLKDSGFRALGDRWIASEQSIGQVNPAEVLKIDEYNPSERE